MNSVSGSRPAPANQPLVQAFGERVRLYRQRSGLSQEDLAHSAGVHRTFVGQLERAEANPTLATIIRIAKALQVRPGELLDGLEQLPVETGEPRRPK